MKSLRLNSQILTFSFFSILLFESCHKEDVRSGQLINNSDVEIGSTTPNSWYFSTGDGKYDVTWTDAESFSPSKSLKISTQTADPTDFAAWGQTINTNLPTGKSVTLKVKVKGNMTGAGISIVIRGDDTPNPSGNAEQFITTQGTSPISGTFDWTDYSVTLDHVDASTRSLIVYLVYLQDTAGEVYFDDILLTF
jgi:hypothetical protein